MPAVVEQGDWYLSAFCPTCQTYFRFLGDLSQGTSTLIPYVYRLICPDCYEEVHCHTNDVKRDHD
jgi:hypothetical protein